MKYIIKESQYNNTIDKFITYYLEPHEEKRTEGHPKSVFWVKDGEVVAEIKESAFFWVNHKIWRSILLMFSLKHTETRGVIKDWLEEHYKSGELTPLTLTDDNPVSWRRVTN
jgi:hypothetical protein